MTQECQKRLRILAVVAVLTTAFHVMLALLREKSADGLNSRVLYPQEWFWILTSLTLFFGAVAASAEMTGKAGFAVGWYVWGALAYLAFWTVLTFSLAHKLAI